MHADLVYDTNLDGEVKTRLRAYANELRKRVKFALESEAHQLPWKGSDAFEKYNI
jgi:hypothetical protein